MEIDIKKIAKLSRLAIEPEREEKFQKDMQNIIDMVEQLPEMEAGDLSPKVEDAMALRPKMRNPALHLFCGRMWWSLRCRVRKC